jgi:hypothetical protein
MGDRGSCIVGATEDDWAAFADGYADWVAEIIDAADGAQQTQQPCTARPKAGRRVERTGPLEIQPPRVLVGAGG